jgi:hypothetical protein
MVLGNVIVRRSNDIGLGAVERMIQQDTAAAVEGLRARKRSQTNQLYASSPPGGGREGMAPAKRRNGGNPTT